MVLSQPAFLARLYEEYLGDAAFLYAQRRKLLAEEYTPWTKIARLEERIAALLDGLAIGAERAVDVCGQRVSSGDPGELYAAIRLFCRRDCRDLVLTTLDGLDAADQDQVAAVADALKCEMPAAWNTDFLTILEAGDGRLAPLLARVFAYRRIPCGPAAMRAMKRCAASALPDMVWALGRIAWAPAAGALFDCLRSQEEPARLAAAVALLRLGERGAIDYCLDQAASHDWPLPALALAGGRRVRSRIAELARTRPSPEAIRALGLLGDPASVTLLLDLLRAPEATAFAADALHCLTAAPLAETVFVPDDMQERELFKGKVFGSTVTRVSRDLQDWAGWWRANGSRFVEGLRYRRGRLCSPAATLDLLAAESSTLGLREFCLDELAIRNGIDTGMETDMSAVRQAAMLTKIAVSASPRYGEVQEGAWYFAGHQIQ
jgi:hypothetical protein